MKNTSSTTIRKDGNDMGRQVTVEKMAKGLCYSGSMSDRPLKEVNYDEACDCGPSSSDLTD